MNRDQRWIANAFLHELDRVKFYEQPRMHTIDRRLALAEMVLTEIPGDDPEEIALRADAEALRELCWDPTNVNVIARYLEARAAHANLLKSVFPLG